MSSMKTNTHSAFSYSNPLGGIMIDTVTFVVANPAGFTHRTAYVPLSSRVGTPEMLRRGHQNGSATILNPFQLPPKPREHLTRRRSFPLT
eukprot:958360-Rhodomonas_salina.2